MSLRRHKDLLPPLLLLAIALAAWEIGPLVFSVPTYVLPRPSEVCVALWNARALAVRHLGVTLVEALAGFALGSSIGIFVGVCIAQWRVIRRLTLPYVIASNAIPVVAIAPIVVLWFGHGIWAKSIVAAFLCFFPTVINTYRGLVTYERIYEDLFRVYGSTEWQFFSKFKFVNALVFVFAGLRLSGTYAVIGAVVAEFVGSTAGLGFGMLQATYNLNTARLFGYLVIACALGTLMYGAVVFAESLFMRKRRIEV